MERVPEGGDHLLALVAAHQAVVHEHAGQLVADRPVHEQRGHRGVDPARQAADHPALTHLCADARDLLVDDRRRAPGALAPAHVGQEALEDRLPVRRMHDLGVELDAVDAALDVLQRGHRRRRGRGQRGEAGRGLEDRVAVRHPARLLRRQAGQQPAGIVDVQVRAAELADVGGLDPAAQVAREQLHAVADAQHRDAQLQQASVERRGAVGVHRRGAAGEDQAAGPAAGHLLDAHVVREKLGEHPQLPHPPRDQLRVLPPVVQHHHFLGGHPRLSRRGHGGRGDVSHLRVRPPWSRWPPCPRPGRAGAACPRSAGRGRPSARRG